MNFLGQEGGAENARVDNAGVDNSARRRRGGHRGSSEAWAASRNHTEERQQLNALWKDYNDDYTSKHCLTRGTVDISVLCFGHGTTVSEY